MIWGRNELICCLYLYIKKATLTTDKYEQEVLRVYKLLNDGSLSINSLKRQIYGFDKIAERIDALKLKIDTIEPNDMFPILIENLVKPYFTEQQVILYMEYKKNSIDLNFLENYINSKVQARS